MVIPATAFVVVNLVPAKAGIHFWTILSVGERNLTGKAKGYLINRTIRNFYMKMVMMGIVMRNHKLSQRRMKSF